MEPTTEHPANYDFSKTRPFKVVVGLPTAIEFESDGQTYFATVVVAVHAVIDKGRDCPDLDSRFHYRVSLAIDTQPK